MLLLRRNGLWEPEEASEAMVEEEKEETVAVVIMVAYRGRGSARFACMSCYNSKGAVEADKPVMVVQAGAGTVGLVVFWEKVPGN